MKTGSNPHHAKDLLCRPEHKTRLYRAAIIVIVHVVDAAEPKGQVAERLLATAPTEIAIPAISVCEIETGIAKSREPGKRRKQFDQLLELVTILPFDQAAANHAAAVRASLEDTGQPIGPLDTLIAGTVLAHNAILVTRNLREFERVPKLLLVNWFD